MLKQGKGKQGKWHESNNVMLKVTGSWYHATVTGGFFACAGGSRSGDNMHLQLSAIANIDLCLAN